jgi:phosphomannomutase
LHTLSAAFTTQLFMAIIRSISGLRATTDELTKELIESYAHAFGTYIPHGPIVIGRDGRPSGAWMEEVIIDTLLQQGHDIIQLGIAPTPTVQLETEHSHAMGGISITASHNPSQWNGMKFLNADGVFLNATENQEFWSILDSGKILGNPSTHGTLIMLNDAVQRHVENVMIALQKMNISIPDHAITAVVDAVNASGSRYVPAMLDALQCTSIPLYCDQSGIFPHVPEPLSDNLGELMTAVKNTQADLGIAVDPDADRLVLIDELGEPIGEEKTIALCVKALLECSEPPIQYTSIALNLSTSIMSEKLAVQAGWDIHRTPVGEINVVESMKSHGSIIGGEGSGGVILPACHYGRDSLIGIALIIALMKQTQKTLSALAGELPRTTMIKGKIAWHGPARELFEKIQRHFQDSCTEVRHDDGIWLKFAHGWMHIRTSNTEPILRYIVEQEQAYDAKAQVQILQELLHTQEG